MADDTLTFEGFRLHAFQRHGSKLPWFVLAEACEVLGIANHRDAASRLDDDEKGVGSTDTLGGSQQMLCVSLSGLTRLAATSRKPIAKRFNKWLHSDVVTTLYDTGEYIGDVSPLYDLVRTFQPQLDLRGGSVNPAIDDDDADDAKARRIWKGEVAAPQPSIREEKRVEYIGAVPIEITARYSSLGDCFALRFIQASKFETPTELRVVHPTVEGKTVVVAVTHVVPLALIEREFAKLGQGRLSEVALNTLRHYLAF